MDFIVNSISDSIGNKIDHHLNLDKKTQKLKRKFEELDSQREDVELRMMAELQPGKRLKKEVELWLGNVRRINDKKQSIENEIGEGKFFKRASLGEIVAEMIQEVEELHQNGRFFEGSGLVLDAPPRKGEIFPPTKLRGETTALRNMEKIWDFLMDDETKMIGVVGMGGIGKTTVMQQINNRLVEQVDKFNHVIWVTVSKVLNVNKIQDCIASKLKVNLSECQDETVRATELFAELREKKRCVLILDDVWEAFEPKYVGIPEPTSANGCKIVLTTRSLDICREMECRCIKMELLSKHEAWNLFLDNVGRIVLDFPGLEAIVGLVVEECACLPLVIITIARSMKGVMDECEWRNALEELRGATGGLIDMEKVLEQLKYSYSRLKDEKLQQCLLYCALYPEDFEIKRKELIMHLIDEGIIEGTSRQAEFDNGHSILNKLENACLLERVTNDYNSVCVKMHDLIRDMALQIMGRRYMVEAGVQLRDLPGDEKWTKNLERVSLVNNNISEIHFGASPRCDMLLTLLLVGNGGLRTIPDSFFLFMCGLRVLDLSHTGIEILPNSISNLKNLIALSLRWCCNLKYVPSLAELRVLRKLDLSGSGIEEVPEGMAELINLRYLNLNAEYLRSLPDGILPKLCRLQCLIVWWASKTLKIRRSEVRRLMGLETFAGQFQDLSDYNAFVKFLPSENSRTTITRRYFSYKLQRPRKYLLQVGPQGEFLDFDEEESYFSKYVGLTECRISSGGGDPLLLLPDIKELGIKECHDVRSLSHVSSVEKTNQSLKYCKIIKCDGIECVISSAYIQHPRLEVVQLEDLRNLRVLYAASLTQVTPFEYFSALKVLSIVSCPSIRRLFMPELLPNLKNLEEINVKNCSGME